jgi:hypothetical protein
MTDGIVIDGVEEIKGMVRYSGDEYVPFCFETAKEALGCISVVMGNDRNRRVLLQVQFETRLLRGVTLVSGTPFEAWPVIPAVSYSAGVPRLVQHWPNDFMKAMAAKPRRDFVWALHGNQFAVTWGDLQAVDRGCSYGGANFLMTERELLGVHFPGLPDDAAARLHAYAQQRA